MTPIRGAIVAQADIMIVDDNPSNLKLLEDMLSQQGYGVCSFPLGRLALASAMKNLPSLILLDVNMPEMNGYEVCEQLKSSPQLADIPVIFLSALTEVEDKVKAFRSGAVDYISKPFQVEEVRARVETHLKLHGLQQALKLQNEHLEEAVAVRTRELDEAKNEFLNLISHEFRTPLNGLLGVGELILEGMPVTRENVELQELFQHSRQRILTILNDALLLTEIDVSGREFKFVPISLHLALSRAIERSAAFAESRGVALGSPGAAPDLILGHEDLLIRALHDLVEAAVKFSEHGGTVRVAREVIEDSLRIVIEGEGRVLPARAASRFFELFSIGEASTPAGDLGLGPAVACRILSLFGASVSVESREPSGIRLIVSFSRDARVGPEAARQRRT
jgi:DNA-binding response OmpR family regulator